MARRDADDPVVEERTADGPDQPTQADVDAAVAAEATAGTAAHEQELQDTIDAENPPEIIP